MKTSTSSKNRNRTGLEEPGLEQRMLAVYVLKGNILDGFLRHGRWIACLRLKTPVEK